MEKTFFFETKELDLSRALRVVMVAYLVRSCLEASTISWTLDSVIDAGADSLINS